MYGVQSFFFFILIGSVVSIEFIYLIKTITQNPQFDIF